MSDRPSQVLARGLPDGVSKSFRALADHSDVPRTTLQHRALGRRSLADKAQSQQYLTASEEKALVDFCAQQDAIGRPVRIKYIPSIAYSLACRRRPEQRPIKAPGKNWVQRFQTRHASTLQSRKSGALDWKRFDIHNKVLSWFDVIGKVLQDPAILQENVYNMDETGVMLSKLNSVKVLVRAGDRRGCRGARVKRTTITAVECVSASGEVLNPMIIWPASSHRANWTTRPTPGWHYAYSDSGYTDTYLSVQWLRLVFDPQTKEKASGRPRVLICDGFGTHETLEVLEFCFASGITLCRLPSHTSHKLQPCDISLFGPLKAAYRDQIERLERGGVGTIGKEHFTYLYDPARRLALTPRNIRAGWSAAGLFPWNPQKVLDDVPLSLSDSLTVPTITAGVAVQQEPQPPPGPPSVPATPVTPTTPVSANAVAVLQELIHRDAQTLDESSKHRLRRHVQKLSNASTQSFARQNLLLNQNRFLAETNREVRVRRHTKASKIGTARVMTYEDLEAARRERATKDAAKETKKGSRKNKKVLATVAEVHETSASGVSRDIACRQAAVVSSAEAAIDPVLAEAEGGMHDELGTFLPGLQPEDTTFVSDQCERSNAEASAWLAPVARMW